MTQFSANLGFLWQELSLPDAIHAAKRAGFDAVECHWPYTVPAADVKAALAATGLPMLGLNTLRGDVAAGENGLSALPGREVAARAAIDQAIDYAVAIGASSVHVMAGRTEGMAARQTFVDNLAHAAARAAKHGVMVLIEPLNGKDVPGYFLQTTGLAVEIIKAVQAPNLKLMFDCYHVQIMEGEVLARLEALMPHIGHIQIAAVPDRREPDHGILDYKAVVGLLRRLGYARALGAEYRPAGTTEAGLGWMEMLRGA